MVSFCMNPLLANQNCAATFEMCILHSIMSAHFEFCCMGTIIKGGNIAKGSNSLLRFGAWDILIEDKIGDVSSKEFWNKRQSENAVQTAVMRDSLFCVTRLPLTVYTKMSEGCSWKKLRTIIIITTEL